MRAAPLSYVAKLLGHKSIRATEQHDGHLVEDHVEEILRPSIPSFSSISSERCHMAASSEVLTVALIVVGIVFFYRLNALAVSMTRYYESHTNKDRR